MNPARLLAVRSLVSIQKSARYANLELDATLKKNPLNDADRALFTTLVYGVIEREITLNYLIGQFCSRKGHALSPFLRATLQTAFYQLFYLSNIPARAVLFDSAEIAKISEKQSGANLVSAVLRTYLRASEAGRDPFANLEGIEKKSVLYAIPKWMLELWETSYGTAACDEICQSFQSPAPTCLRVNTLKTTRNALMSTLASEGICAEEHPEHDELLLLKGSHGDLRNLESFTDGLFFAQDYSSACAADALGAQPTETVADVCAAPGGKSFALAMHMKNQGILYAGDLHPNRCRLIEGGAMRLGIDILRVRAQDARKPDRSQFEKMDRVLCDVPCSGLGVLSKKPDLRHKSRDELKSLPTVQFEILCESSKLVKTGGKLVYSTCTLNPEENENVVYAFLSKHDDFSLVGEPKTLFPKANLCDGFFFATLEKNR